MPSYTLASFRSRNDVTPTNLTGQPVFEEVATIVLEVMNPTGTNGASAW